MKIEGDELKDSNASGNSQNGHEDSDISLIDFWLVLIRRKWVILAVFFLILGIGSIFAWLRQPKYLFSTAIKIGTSFVVSTEKGLRPQLIESPSAVQAKLENSYILQSLHHYRESHPKVVLPEIKVKVPKDGQIVLLNSNGLVDDEKKIEGLHKLVVEELVSDHAQMLALPRQQLENSLALARLKLKNLEDPKVYAVQVKAQEGKIEQAKSSLENLKDQARVLAVEKQGLIEKAKIYETQIKELRASLKDAKGLRPNAEKNVTGEAEALTFLLVNNQLENNRSRLADLEEKLNVQLNYSGHQLEGKLSENRRQQEAQTHKIEEFQSELVKLNLDHQKDQESQKQMVRSIQEQIDALQNSKALPTVRSLKPVGSGKMLILALAGMIGLMAGVFSAFFIEFLKKVDDFQRIS